MRGAIGNAMVMNIVITFIILTTAFLIGSISYSKAFKVKTNVIDIIEKYNGDFKIPSLDSTKTNQSMIMYEIENYLGKIGYRPSTGAACKNGDLASSSNYDICIYEENKNSTTYRGSYYRVVVYMYFDFPIIGDKLKIPVTGETRSFFNEVVN